MTTQPSSRLRFRPSMAASSKLKKRLARKAELARNSRRRKKAKQQAMLDRIDGLERLVEQLKAANSAGVKWKESEPSEQPMSKDALTTAVKEDAIDDSDSDEEEDDEASTSDSDATSPPSAPSACSLPHCSVSAPTSRCSSATTASTVVRAETRKRSSCSPSPAPHPPRSTPHCHPPSAAATLPTASDDSVEQATKRLRTESASAVDSSARPVEAEKTVATVAATGPPTTLVRAGAPVSSALPLSQVWLESVDEVQALGRPLLSRSLVSLPLSTTFAALRCHLLALQFPSASPAFSFMVGSQVLESAQEGQTLAMAGVQQGAVIRLVRRTLMLAVIGVAEVRPAVTGSPVKLGKADEEAASTISLLAQSGGVAA